MTKRRFTPKAVATDFLGVLMIIGALLFGWLPGPGGIPLLLAGLGLLSINHEWARRWLHKMRDSGNKLNELLFPDNTAIKILYDAIAILLTIGGFYIIYSVDRNFLRSVGIVCFAAALVITFLNRKRLDTLVNKVKRSYRRDNNQN